MLSLTEILPSFRASRLESNERFRWGIIGYVLTTDISSSGDILSWSLHFRMNFPSDGKSGSNLT